MIGGHQPQPPPPRRVTVAGPRRNRTRGWSARAGAEDLHAQPPLGQVYVRSLVRDQLRLSLGVLAVLVVVLGGLPAAFALVPGLRTAEVYGVRVAWLLLGLVAYPVLVGAAWFHVRHAERVERDFTELLAAPDPGPHGARAAGPASGGPSPDLPPGGGLVAQFPAPPKPAPPGSDPHPQRRAPEGTAPGSGAPGGGAE